MIDKTVCGNCHKVISVSSVRRHDAKRCGKKGHSRRRGGGSDVPSLSAQLMQMLTGSGSR